MASWHLLRENYAFQLNDNTSTIFHKAYHMMMGKITRLKDSRSMPRKYVPYGHKNLSTRGVILPRRRIGKTCIGHCKMAVIRMNALWIMVMTYPWKKSVAH